MERCLAVTVFDEWLECYEQNQLKLFYEKYDNNIIQKVINEVRFVPPACVRCIDPAELFNPSTFLRDFGDVRCIAYFAMICTQWYENVIRFGGINYNYIMTSGVLTALIDPSERIILRYFNNSKTLEFIHHLPCPTTMNELYKFYIICVLMGHRKTFPKVLRRCYLQYKYGRIWRDKWVTKSMNPNGNGVLFRKWVENIPKEYVRD
jgi:hypothetical protein